MYLKKNGDGHERTHAKMLMGSASMAPIVSRRLKAVQQTGASADGACQFVVLRLRGLFASFRCRWGALGSALACLFLAGPVLAASGQSEEGLSFSAPFDGTATASFSRVGGGVPLNARGIQFTDGICGQAVYLGGGKEPGDLEYDGTGLFQPEGGTVMFWMRPDWDGYFTELNQNNIYSLFQAQSGNENRVYMFMWNWLRADFKDASLATPFSLEQHNRFSWLRGDWWHIAMAWEKGKSACLYVNGVPNAKPANLNLADIQRFFVGKGNVLSAFDEFTIYGRALLPAEVMTNYRRFAPWDFVLERRFLRADQPEQLALELAPGQGSPATLDGRLQLRVLADADSRVVTEKTTALANAASRKIITVPLAGLPEGAYRLECVLTTPQGRWQRSFPVTVYRQKDAPASSLNDVKKGDCVVSLDCTKEGNGFIAGAATKVQTLPTGEAYREAGSDKWDRFAYEVRIPGADGSPMLLEVTWPDDRERTMAFYMIVEAKYPMHRDRLDGGVSCGGEYPNSGTMQKARYLFYPAAEKYLFEVRTLVAGTPAAVTKLEIYRLAERLPKLAVTAPSGLPARGLGHLDEDQSFEQLIASANDFLSPKSPLPYGYSVRVMEQLLDYFDYTGQKGMSYALARYFWSSLDSGPINIVEPVLKSTGWVLLMLDMMERRGQQLVGEINIFTVPLPAGFPVGQPERIAQDYFSRDRNGSPMVAGELPLSGFGSETAGLGNNPMHPVVRAQFFDLINEILRRYGQHPAFSGIDLWCSPSSPFLLGSLEKGYDDLTVSQFEKDTGIRVPAPQDAGRFAARYSYLTGTKRGEWLAWRAKKTTDLLKELDQALQGCRKDLRLYVGVNGWHDGSPLFLAKKQSENFSFDKWANENLGLDMNALKQIPSVVLVPQKDGTFYRWIKHWHAKESIVTELNWNVDKFRGFRNADRNATAIYLGYFETFSNSLKQDVYPGYFQNADPKAQGRYFLQEFAVALASQDADRIFVGAQPLGTSGRDAESREFTLAYGALPAVAFSDIPGLTDPVTVRYAHTRNGTYLYAVNLLGSPLLLELTMPPKGGTVTDLSGNRPVPVKGQRLPIELQPFQLRSFLLSGKRAEPFSGNVTIPPATRTMYAAKTAELTATLAKLQGKGADVKKQTERLETIKERLNQGAYAEAHRLIFSKWMRGLLPLLREAESGYLQEQQVMLDRSEYAVNCGSATFYRATSGKLFFPDADYTSGGYGKDGPLATSVTRSIQGLTKCADPELFATESYNMDAYRFTVKPGKYTVRLHWKVGYKPGAKPGVFVFNVDLEGARVLSNYDVYLACGQDFNQATVAEFKGVAVQDGVLDIEFKVNPGLDSSARLCNAIEIIPELGAAK